MNHSDIDNDIMHIKNDGSHEDINQLIEDYRPFIIKCISETTKKYVQVENSEELSIGMMAFNEAIEKFDLNRGAFLSFAKLVIRSRVLTYMNKAQKMEPEVSLETYSEPLHNQNEGHADGLKEEIEAFESEIALFGFDVEDLVEACPKHFDTRHNAIRLSKKISGDGELTSELYRLKRLPVSKIVFKFKSTPKILKRSRKFIISVTIVFFKDFRMLMNWINETMGGEEHA